MALPVNKCLRLLIGLLLLAAAPLSAQKVSPMFYKEVQLRHKPYTLHTLTREIQRQSGITFSYDAIKIDPDRKVKLKRNLDRLTVKELLALLRKRTGIGYKIVGSSHIIYTLSGTGSSRKKKGNKPAKYYKSKPARQQYAEPEEEDTAEPYIAVLREDSTLEHQIIVIGDSSLAAGYYLSGSGGNGGIYPGYNIQNNPGTNGSSEEELEEIAEQRNSRASSGGYYTPLGQSAGVLFIKKNTFAEAGLTADETYYLNPTLKMGFSFLYGTLAYNLGNFPHWRYGLGTSARFDNGWSVHLEWSTGNKLAQNYNIQTFDTIFPPPPIDSLEPPEPPTLIEHNRPLLVQSTLNRVTLGVEWDMGKNFSMGGGLSMNFLNTTYSSNGNKVTLSDILPVGIDADEKYRTIKPPYVISNSYSANSTSNTKVWIGLQLRLVYRLNFFER